MKITISVLFFILAFLFSTPLIAKRKNSPGKSEFVMQGYELVDISLDLDSEYTNIYGFGMGGMIDCFLYNSDGYLVDYDIEYENTCNLYYKASKEGTFKLRLKNYSKDKSQIIIRTD